MSKYKQRSEKKRYCGKRKFYGNKKKQIDEPGMADELSVSIDEDIGESKTSNVTSASAKKINVLYYDEESLPDQPTCSTTTTTTTTTTTGDTDYHSSMYMFTDIDIFLNLIKSVGKCPECASNIQPNVDFSCKKGFVNKCVVNYPQCYGTYLSKNVKVSEHSRYDLNVRSIVAFREIGRGLAHMETFSRIMNMPPPLSKSNYQELVNDMSPGYLNAMKDSMKDAAKNAKTSILEAANSESATVESDTEETVNNEVDNREIADEILDCDVSLDGSWQRRGYASLNGIVSVIERINDKVVDIEVMTNDCRSCKHWEGKKSDPGYEKWKADHDCPINHEKSSGSMEPEGAVKIFKRSVEINGLRYINYIGDGDSSAFQTVVKSNPYPGAIIKKLECVGHIQKRVGSRLRKLKEKNKGIGGKGKGKLTDKVINTLQNYYGMAIRNNTGDITMKKSIAAVIHNCTQKDNVSKEVRHQYYPVSGCSWCKFQKNKFNGTEIKPDRINMSEEVFEKVRPIFIELSENLAKTGKMYSCAYSKC